MLIIVTKNGYRKTADREALMGLARTEHMLSFKAVLNVGNADQLLLATLDRHRKTNQRPLTK